MLSGVYVLLSVWCVCCCLLCMLLLCVLLSVVYVVVWCVCMLSGVYVCCLVCVCCQSGVCVVVCCVCCCCLLCVLLSVVYVVYVVVVWCVCCCLVYMLLSGVVCVVVWCCVCCLVLCFEFLKGFSFCLLALCSVPFTIFLIVLTGTGMFAAFFIYMVYTLRGCDFLWYLGTLFFSFATIQVLWMLETQVRVGAGRGISVFKNIYFVLADCYHGEKHDY